MQTQQRPVPLWKNVLNLAAPQTWAGSMAPATVAIAISWHKLQHIDLLMVLCLFVIAILMQSAVNAFDDYADFIKGTDTLENSPDAQDAVIVYGMNPRTALISGICFLLVALIPGAYVVIKLGIVPLIIGIIGGIVLIFYAFGPYPICYLPLGEAFCGFVLGGLMPFAGVYMQTGVLDFFVLVEVIPPILGMAINMFSNNGCDIARDKSAGRKTLACLIGQKRTDALYRVGLIIWVLSPAIVLASQGRFLSVLIYCLASLAYVHLIEKQYKRQLGPEERGNVMNGATTLVSLVAFTYSIAMIVG
jgi:1,4-dihydroxy-2-naphthoate octaprenyltransferase